MEPVSSSGTFAETSCPRLLVRLHLEAFSGTLRISVGAVLKLLYFQSGEIAMASSNDQADHLAPILMRAGKLKTEQLDLARKQAKAGTSLARVLVQMGFLTSGELFAGARQQLRQIVGSVLGLAEGRYDVQEGYFPREVTSLNVDTRELLIDLIKELPERSFVLLEVGAPDTVYSPSSPPPGEAQAPPKLPRAWQAHAARFSAPMTIHAFGQGAGLDDFSASKVVYALHLFGWLAAEPGEPEPEEILPEELPSRAAAGGEEATPLPPLASPAEPARIEVAAPPEEEASEPPPPEVDAPSPPPAPAAAAPAQPIAASPAPAGEIFRSAAAHEPEELVARGGPIRLEFKGTLPASRARAASSRWGILSVITGIALLAAGFVWFVFLRGSPVPASPQAASGEERAAPEAATLPEPAADSASAAAQAPPGEPENPPTESPSPPPPAATSSPESSSAGDQAPAAAAGQAEPSQDSATGSRRAARSLLDAGNAEAAAAAWLSALTSEAPGGFTLQLSIACREESVRKAAERTRNSADFFIVPFALQGKACYRLCWGNYGTLAEAESGKAAVPGFFLDEGAKPVVVSVARLDAGKR
ncbi:MAG TPA: DUF4388 domain-containing protein [Candidatus Polarisedimenticolia bacterium]|jgi:hypothetical protein|nr:DUF4388 domain-containing protein [Candidatus Polarisedimenticolia bacterium]